MAGAKCSDRGQKELGGFLCVFPRDHPDPNMRGVVTDQEGLVPEIKNESQDNVTFIRPYKLGEITVKGEPISVENTRKMKGAEAGDCTPQGGPISFEVVPISEKITWTPKDQITLSPLFGGRIGRVFLCSDRENYGGLAINKGIQHVTQFAQGVKRLRNECSELLGKDSDAKCDALKGVAELLAQEKKQESHIWDLVGVGVVFSLVHIIGHFAVKAIEKILGKKGKGGGSDDEGDGDANGGGSHSPQGTQGRTPTSCNREALSPEELKRSCGRNARGKRRRSKPRPPPRFMLSQNRILGLSPSAPSWAEGPCSSNPSSVPETLRRE
jgi:hypothetical protein